MYLEDLGKVDPETENYGLGYTGNFLKLIILIPLLIGGSPCPIFRVTEKSGQQSFVIL